MDKVTVIEYDRIFKNFIDEKYLDGRDEYYYRNKQTETSSKVWRHLRADEVESLVKNSNTATRWDDIMVTDEFDTNLVKNNRFFGLVRISRRASLPSECSEVIIGRRPIISGMSP